MPPAVLVDVDESLAGLYAGDERDDALITVKASGSHEASRDPFVHVGKVANRVPGACGIGPDVDLFADGCHTSIIIDPPATGESSVARAGRPRAFDHALGV